jgi:DNA repair photolyase
MAFPPQTHAPINDETALPNRVRKGRGSVSNRTSARFGNADRYEFDDGWTQQEREGLARQKTTLGIDTVRHIISSNTSPDVGFSRSINPYKGCEHGCVYCFARPSHAYLDLSPGLDFETRIFRKPDAAKRLRAELSHPKYAPQTLALGINTDAYQPTERSEKLTRSILEVLSDFNHPCHIVTKSSLILRDLDILAPMAERGLFSASVSITTLDRHVARAMEPRAATPTRRLDTVRGLNQAGIPVNVMVAPVVPGLTCHEIEAIVEASAEAGARSAAYVLLRLPHEVKILFEEWLELNFPDRAAKVLNLVRQCHGGKLYDAEFRTRMRGTGPYAQLIGQRFRLAVKKHGLDKPRQRVEPAPFKGGNPQLSLF